jgi:hypothetical protein
MFHSLEISDRVGQSPDRAASALHNHHVQAIVRHWDAFSRHIRYGEKRSPAGKLYHYHIEVVAATSRKGW